MQPPRGDAVTLVFTDIERSTSLWEGDPEATRQALAAVERAEALLAASQLGPASGIVQTIGALRAELAG